MTTSPSQSIAASNSFNNQAFRLKPVACVSSDTLLNGKKRLLIEHAGALYCLQLTQNGKLILTK
jgi:hemin uptake protein HemP